MHTADCWDQHSASEAPGYSLLPVSLRRPGGHQLCCSLETSWVLGVTELSSSVFFLRFYSFLCKYFLPWATKYYLEHLNVMSSTVTALLIVFTFILHHLYLLTYILALTHLPRAQQSFSQKNWTKTMQSCATRVRPPSWTGAGLPVTQREPGKAALRK